jgi:hypothetical protein
MEIRYFSSITKELSKTDESFDYNRVANGFSGWVHPDRC